MDDGAYRQAQDEQDVTIVSLDNVPGDKLAPSPLPLRSPLAPRFSPRQRKIQLAVTVSLVVCAMLLLIGSYAPLWNDVLRGLQGSTPVPTAKLLPGSDLFYVNMDLSWASLSIDGKAIPHIPIYGKTGPLRLTRGRHKVVWTARPFEPQTCLVSVPPAIGDTCWYESNANVDSTGAWLLNFSTSLAVLPGKEHNALIEATTQALNSQTTTETIQAGEKFAVNSVLVKATTSLRATMHLQLDTTNNPNGVCTPINTTEGSASLSSVETTACSLGLNDCYQFCTTSPVFQGQSSSYVNGSQQWDVVGVIRAVWDYTTMDGKIVARDQPDAILRAGRYEHLVPLEIHWDGSQWHVVPFPSGNANFPGNVLNPACAAAIDDVEINHLFAYTQQGKRSVVRWSYISGSNFAQGCLRVVTVGADPAAPQQIAYSLFRFGSFVAANDLARTLWPGMMVADTYEQHLAQQLALAYKSLNATL